MCVYIYIHTHRHRHIHMYTHRYALARNNLGMLLFRKGRLREAEEQYIQGLKDNTHNELIGANLKLLRNMIARNT